jgi:hypothetical protein
MAFFLYIVVFFLNTTIYRVCQGKNADISEILEKGALSAKSCSDAGKQGINPKSETLNTKQYLNPNAQILNVLVI